MALTMTPQNCPRPMVNGQKMTMTIDTLSFPHGQQTIYRHFVIKIYGKIFSGCNFYVWDAIFMSD